jgi:Ca2+-binding RTX toxin-like protein
LAVVDLQGLFGGQQDAEQTAFFIDLVRRPEFRSLYTDYLNIWKDNGGGLMAQFSDFGLPSRYGSWGIWDSAFSPETPRSLAVQAFRDGVDVWWSDARPADTFLDGVTRIDTAVSNRQNGSAYDDHLFGLGGVDTAFGGDGRDLIHTGTGGDTGYGGQAQDTVLGGSGADIVFGGKGHDSLYGGTHGDQVHGKTGDDRIMGDSGSDTLLGGKEDDIIFGGDGDDSITGGAGRDVLSGQAGEDSFVFAAGHGGARVTDFNVRQDHLVLDLALLNPGESLSNVVANHARITDKGVLFAFDDGTHILLQGLATTAGLTGALLLS